MIYRRKTYKIIPEKLEEFTAFFHEYLYPNQITNGAKLVGRWVTEDKSEVVAIWEYLNQEHYESIEKAIRSSELHRRAQARRKELGEVFVTSSQDFMHATGTYHPPRHIVAVSALITNDKGEILLVKNHHRADTYEIPGGQLENGETLAEGAIREVLEETGVSVSLTGITGIYQNMTKGIVSVVFRGEYISGEPLPDGVETKEVFFHKLDKNNAGAWITRPHFLTRVLDALEPTYLPAEAFNLHPYELISRFEAEKEK
ncbi:ADP-ribose pyrophosphatase YjhB (NUDIX family) [Bacillus tianshenii]|uniref:ADP-ribose pyrophosphatase YjhB (NUDIX family) n=1 Tax=Sutcliffiella tianshenii TaxID=1463404 RepID=A0ABS2NXJ7_9BACI|nr:NUDIX domain-containing protein [Bacillus tianshenii]MBM7619238.1 ADP-ribose pyrophosphatase YjhB (NUDIX family) [Bacillus tianshenii]